MVEGKTMFPCARKKLVEVHELRELELLEERILILPDPGLLKERAESLAHDDRRLLAHDFCGV